MSSAEGSPGGGNTASGDSPGIPELIAEVYETAPPVDRGHMLEQLLRPLGVLSLLAIADGIFLKIRFRSGWQDMHVRLEDVPGVQPAQIAALADHVQQVSIEAVDGLAQLVLGSPSLSGSAAAMLLVGLLLRRSQRGPLASSRAGETLDDA